MPEPYQEKRQKPWGYEVIYTPKSLARTGKLLRVNAGSKLSLQYHTEKEETICLVSGEAILWYQEKGGELEKIAMTPDSGYTIYPETIHRIEAVTDALLVEVSMPEQGTTVRLEDDYQRSDETYS